MIKTSALIASITSTNALNIEAQTEAEQRHWLHFPGVTVPTNIFEFDATNHDRPLQEVGGFYANGIKTGVTGANYFRGLLGEVTARDNFGYTDLLVGLGDDSLSAQVHGFEPLDGDRWPGDFWPLHENHVNMFEDRVTTPDLAAARTWLEGKRERAKHLQKQIWADSDQCH